MQIDLNSLAAKNEWSEDQRKKVEEFLSELWKSTKLIEAFGSLPWTVGNPNDIRDLMWSAMIEQICGVE